VTPPGGRSHGETRVQRPIAQPFVRVNAAQILFPARVPTTRARCGPPYTSVHTASRGTGAKSLAPPAASRRQATAGRRRVPRGGLQRSVHVTLESGFALFSQNVTRSDVVDDVPASTVTLAMSAPMTSARVTIGRIAFQRSCRREGPDRPRPSRYCHCVLGYSGRRVLVSAGTILVAVVLLVAGARFGARAYHDDSLWANSLRSVGGLQVPFDFGVFLQAGEAVRQGESPYVDPDVVISEDLPAPYVYPPVLAYVVAPLTFLPETIAGSSAPGVLFTLILIGCTLGTLLALGVADWRCYPIALFYPVTLENVEYGAIGPILALFVALGWRYRDRAFGGGGAIGAAVVLKVFLGPLVVWLTATRRGRGAGAAVATAAGLALVSWAAIGFRGLVDYPSLLRRLSDLEAERSYSVFALLRTVEVPELVARGLVLAASATLLALAWRAGRAHSPGRSEHDRRSLTYALAAGFVLTPILWLHYLVLLVVPIALARPRLSALWFAPLALTVFEALDWYRGWPRGDGRALVSVALVVAFVFTASLRSRGHASEAPRGVPART